MVQQDLVVIELPAALGLALLGVTNVHSLFHRKGDNQARFAPGFEPIRWQFVGALRTVLHVTYPSM
jgi:hypothetical protein